MTWSDGTPTIVCELCGHTDYPETFTWHDGELAICQNTNMCVIRQIGPYQMSTKDITFFPGTTPQPSDQEKFIKRAKLLTSVNFNSSHLGVDRTSRLTDFYVVWFVKVLGNWKALVSTDIVGDQYWEVTYNGEKKEAYVDHYEKVSNQKYIDEIDDPSLTKARHERDRIRREMTQSTIDKARALRDDNVTNIDIATQLGLDESTVRTLLEK